MAWLAVDKDGWEWAFTDKPKRVGDQWQCPHKTTNCRSLQEGFIDTFFGTLTWDDEPIEIRQVL